MKRLALFLTGLIFLPAMVLAYQSPGKPAGWVNDYAGLLSSADSQQLNQKLSDYTKQSGNEITVVTINSLAGDTIENFAAKLFRDWGIGKKGQDNGLLILIARDDRKMRIEVGYGLEGSLTDAQSYWLINNVLKPAFQEQKYFDGLNQAVDKIISALQGGAKLPSDTSANDNQLTSEMTAISNYFWLVIFIIMWLGSLLARSKSWWAGGAVGGAIGVAIGLLKGFLYFGLFSMVILIPLGLLFDFIVSRSYSKGKARGYIPWWIGGGKGGFGGGSGGFGGFGGGGSGGGGSGGSW
ncbi:MAG: TPM domain-containing protein [Candidatus Kerfeldbacteria bacterium]|nr:TPM domain-containing protein [Candidatus Kerfeldbacteria bacterium]